MELLLTSTKSKLLALIRSDEDFINLFFGKDTGTSESLAMLEEYYPKYNVYYDSVNKRYKLTLKGSHYDGKARDSS
jgi:hypothetical protein